MLKPTKDALFGLSEDHLVGYEPDSALLHPDVIMPLEQLKQEARQAGFDLRLASGYRSFARQKALWNAKALGQKPVLDERGRPLDALGMTERDRVYAILRWSALPGGSRHHWGTDMDVFDAAALVPGQNLALTREETRGDGPMAPLHHWLDEWLVSAGNKGFYRPYDRDRGGVAPEPWHLSYRPLAARFASRMSLSALTELLASQEDLALGPVVLDELPAIYRRFVLLP